MDLCLRGSQINLAIRQKPKPKYSSQTNLHHSLHTSSRPRSATSFQKRNRSSASFLSRPLSADPRLRRQISDFCGNYCSEEVRHARIEKNIQKRFQSVSSSDILKLLLEEPIKRSWLCRGNTSVGGGSTPDDQSDLSSSQKVNGGYLSFSKRTRTDSACGVGGCSGGGGGTSSAESEASDLKATAPQKAQRKSSSSSSATKMSSSSSLSNLTKERPTSTSSTYYLNKSQSTTDYFNASAGTHSLSSKTAKPDLPGRVSFCKPNLQNDIDFSDCDNDKQEPTYSNNPYSSSHYSNYTNNNSADANGDDISAPGPLTIPTLNFSSKFDTKPKLTRELSAASLKKTVHFGPKNGGEVLAETYEYPKCPSENCSCSTRSSSTASLHETLDNKCACDSTTCKYAAEAGRRPNSAREHEKPATTTNSTAPITNSTTTSTATTDTSAVIRNYKSVVGEQLDGAIVKNLLEQDKPKPSTSNSAFGSLNNGEVPPYLEKYACTTKTDNLYEKQNNLAEAKNFNSYATSSKKNLLESSSTAKPANKRENNFDQNIASKIMYSSTSDSVINNYLKVTASPPLVTKKRENKPPSADALPTVNNVKCNKKIRSKNKTKLPNNNMNGNGNGNVNSTGNDASARLKKSKSFGNLRDDTNLDEFQLDKVDSWMSMHEEVMARQKSVEKPAEKDETFENMMKKPLEFNWMEEREEELGDSGSQGSTKTDDNSQEEEDSTYNEIVSVIKEIEEDKKQDNYAERVGSDMDLKLRSQSDMSETPQVSSNRNERSQSPDKYTDILNYLDNVEDSCEKTLLETRRSMPDSNRSEVEFVIEPDIAEDVPKLSDLLLLPNHQLARRVVALSLRANELANAVHLSKEQIIKVRTEKQKTLRAEKANTSSRLREQKKHYETIVQRHQGFIEQLLKDKGSLCEKVAALTRRLESQNQAWEHKLETELTRAKETALAGEKIRRERWVRENTKKIKDLTVKGIEAEINRMTCEHQQQIIELKRTHQQQLLDALEEARVKHEQIENSIRESCAQDREAIIEKERAAIRERFERQLEEERKLFDEQKQKLAEELAAERERFQNELKAKEIEYQNRRQELMHEKDAEMAQTIAELQEKMSKQDEKYQNRINTIEKQYLSDFDIWKRDYENNSKMAQAEKENTIRQHYRDERDRQIDAIVSRMDAEAQKTAEDYETKLNRIKDKYEKDLHDAEVVEKSLRDKYTETRNKLAESDAQVQNLQAEMKQLRIELEHSKKMCSEFLEERDQMRDNIRNELQNEVAHLKTERDNEIQKIHKRVQQAIEKKDATIDFLQKENGTLRERCLKLEAIIRQQRKDYCVK